MSFQAYLDTIRTKTGKTPEQLCHLATEKGLMDPPAKAAVITAWLAQDFGLGHGHAMALFAYLRGKTE